MNTLLKTILSISILFLVSCSDEKLNFIDVGKLTGRVVEANSFTPISNAKITMSPTNNSVFTDSDGYFSIDEVLVGDYSVRAQKEGYLAENEPVSISADVTTNVIFELEFSDALNKPPFAPVIISPLDNTLNLPTTVELKWRKAVDPDDDVLTYGIKVRNDYDESTISVGSLVDTTYTLNALKHGVKYFWQVSANDGIHEDVLTNIYSFKTTSFPNNRFLYVRNSNNNHVIYSADESDNNIVLTSLAQNCWRPRKNLVTQRIAFLKNVGSNTHIFTMKPDGTDVQQVTTQIPLVGFKQDELDFAWSNNGNRILYASFDKLYMINKDGSGNQLIYQTYDGSFITECDWSQDETKIALKTNNSNGYNSSIFIIDMNGNIIKNILTYVNGAVGGLNFSVNNQYLLYCHDISGYESSNYRQLDTHIFSYNLISNTTSDLSTYKVAGSIDLDPRFSPNEAKIIFENTSNDGVSIKRILTMELSGDSREILFENAYMPDWE